MVDNFVPYQGLGSCTATDQRLFCILSAVDRSSPDAREQMELLARRYVADTLPGAGPFVPAAAALTSPLDRFAHIQPLLRGVEFPGVGPFVEVLCSSLGVGWNDLVTRVRARAFAEELDRVWQSVFALCIVRDHDRGALDALTDTVLLAALLIRIVASLPAQAGNAPAPLPAAATWPPQRLRRGLAATLALPEPVFPLPPARGAVESGTD